jgi:acetyl esterase
MGSIHVLRQASGAVVASIEYRLAPEHKSPTQLHDVVDAIEYVRSIARTFGADPDRVAITGESAGGQLSIASGESSMIP